MKEIIIDTKEEIYKIAFLEDKELIDLKVENKKNKSIVGNIYLGKVINILPGMQVAFIEIGMEKKAFLHVGDIVKKEEEKDFPIQKILRCGQEILVQVQKDAMGTKGPKVTGFISLTGKYLVYLPCEKDIGISKKIIEEEERKRIKNIFNKELKQEGGWIVRTSSLKQKKEVLLEEAEFLIKRFKSIHSKSKYTKAPKLMYEEMSFALKILRDYFGKGYDKFIINDFEECEKLKSFSKDLLENPKDIFHFYDSDYPIFEYYEVENKIKKALQRKVWLKSGGYLIFDKTEALTIIDVNTGKFIGKKDLEQTVFEANKEAAIKIAKQLRLRNIGGIIIIDFIDMEDSDHKKQIIDLLKEEVKKDRVKCNVVGMTSLGLIEMTRKKTSDSLLEVFTSPCSQCNGAGRIFRSNKIIDK